VVTSERRGKPTLTTEFENFCGSLGIGVHLCRPRDPEAKGITERNNSYFETSFLPGRGFTGPEDFNTQFGGWLATSNARHGQSAGSLRGCRTATRPTPPRLLLATRISGYTPRTSLRHGVRSA